MWNDALRDLGPGHRFAPGAEPGTVEKFIADIAQNGLDPANLPVLLAAGFMMAVWITGRHLQVWSRDRY
ncbi:hypothetical protein LNKW23_46770 [Paralimibaculum aggregatum]|uniref:Uncharacterized protein n=1 Tax=Paralimibaculum aggregatum TaxID=3036245 RepID=A0ABQ6LTQ3_9RHOB|nr:hypothetical protein [Limibaculum sp. NKW23]GMG85457.1 hypothetical protein LNKW23_46770 [Limibaculum sp. NKW23]